MQQQKAKGSLVMACKTIGLGVGVVVALAYGAAVGYACLAKEPDQRSVEMLHKVRHQLAQRGVEAPEKNIGLDFGRYAGCRLWLLEHVVADGCISFRIEDSVRSKASPEAVREIADQLCRTGECAYGKPFVLSVRYLRIARTYQTDSSITTVREQSGSLAHFWLEGSNK